MDYSVLTEKDDLARCRNQPLSLRELCAPVTWNSHGYRRHTRVWKERVERRQLHACFNQRALEILNQVLRILNADTQSNEIFWQTPRRAGRRVD